MKKIFLISAIIFTSIFLFVFINFIQSELMIKDICLDSGFCKEGSIIKTIQGKEIVVSLETCQENNGSWNNKQKLCKF